MTLIEKLVEDAKAAPSRRVALPECEADKTLLAARRVLDELLDKRHVRSFL